MSSSTLGWSRAAPPRSYAMTLHLFLGPAFKRSRCGRERTPGDRHRKIEDPATLVVCKKCLKYWKARK